MFTPKLIKKFQIIKKQSIFNKIRFFVVKYVATVCVTLFECRYTETEIQIWFFFSLNFDILLSNYFLNKMIIKN